MWNRQATRSQARLGLIALALSACTGGATVAARASEPPPPSLTDGAGLEDYVRLALRRSRRAAAARGEWEASSAWASRAGALPDPVLSYGHYFEEVQTRVGPQRQRIGLSQRFPWFGTLGSREKSALALAEGTFHRYAYELQQIRREVAEGYAEYYYLAVAIETTRDSQRLLELWERAISARYTVGDATYASLIQAQMEVARLEDRLRSLTDQRRFRMARLNALLDLPVETDLPPPSRLPEEPGLPERAELRQALTSGSPELLSLRSGVESHAHEVDVARKESYPGFMVGLDWIRTDPRNVPGVEPDGADPIVATVGIRLPLWFGKHSASRREASARRVTASERLAEHENVLVGNLESLAYRFEDAERRIRLYEHSLLPKANQTLEVSYAGFETGRERFLDVLDAQRTLLELRLSMERARSDRLRHRAGIDALLGRALPEEVFE